MIPKCKIVLCLIIGIFTSTAISQVRLPDDHFEKGWKKSSRTLVFHSNDLINYIKGGAELFLEFGFEDLHVQRYAKDDAEIGIEVYRMESPESAMGIYLMNKGAETQIKGIPARHAASRLQITILRGSYFILINNYSGSSSLQKDMAKASRAVLARIPLVEPSNVFDILPAQNRIQDSETIFRGPFGLQSIFTFGQGDILKLGGKVFGVSADYTTEEGDKYTRLIIRYPDVASFKMAFHSLVTFFDPYLEILNIKEDGFIFKDYQEKFGVVEAKDQIIDIWVHISEYLMKSLTAEN